MKKLLTTHEQSKRLLDLGVPANSADMCYKINYESMRFDRIPTAIPYKDFTAKELYCPCWSVGRLIEIHLKCCTTLNQNDAHIVISRFGIETGGLLQNMYDMMTECALLGKYDFSKLEEQV